MDALLKVDLRELFDRLPHPAVRRAADQLSGDPHWRRAVDRYLQAWPVQPGRGVPQGAPLSPLLANLVLAEVLDQPLLQTRARWVRYADDLTTLLDEPPLPWLDRLQALLRRAGLELKHAKTALEAGPLARPVQVLGFPLVLHRRRLLRATDPGLLLR